MRALTVRLPDDKHSRLETLARPAGFKLTTPWFVADI